MNPNPTDADAWHRVTAPGGYEWWYFDAEDPATDTQVVAIFLEGFVFHPGYLRKYFAYRRRPASVPPPLPGDFPCAYFAIYQRGRVLGQFMTQYPPAAFAASIDTPEVSIGPNRMRRDGDGRYALHLEGSPWHLTWRGPRRPVSGRLSADFTFAPRWPLPPHQRPFLSRQMTGDAVHQWIIAAPLCDVSGTVRLTAGTGSPEQVIEFGGRGYHDHNYGTAPLGPGLRRWTWGRVLLEDRAALFHVATPRERGLKAEAHLIEADSAGIRTLPPESWRIAFGVSGLLWTQYPHEMDYADRLFLGKPRVVDASPFYLRLTHEARWDGVDGTAFSEVAYPHRLRWPILGRMIEMSIEKKQ